MLKKIYPHLNIKKPAPPPSFGLNSSETRYRADSLIHFLSEETAGGELSIGLTTKDISTTKGGIADWGINGPWVLSWQCPCGIKFSSEPEK